MLEKPTAWKSFLNHRSITPSRAARTPSSSDSLSCGNQLYNLNEEKMCSMMLIAMRRICQWATWLEGPNRFLCDPMWSLVRFLFFFCLINPIAMFNGNNIDSIWLLVHHSLRRSKQLSKSTCIVHTNTFTYCFCFAAIFDCKTGTCVWESSFYFNVVFQNPLYVLQKHWL